MTCTGCGQVLARVKPSVNAPSPLPAHDKDFPKCRDGTAKLTVELVEVEGDLNLFCYGQPNYGA